MFRYARDPRRQQAAEIVRTGQKQIADIEKQIEALLGRVRASTNDTLIGTYEGKISQLGERKLLLGKNFKIRRSRRVRSKKN